MKIGKNYPYVTFLPSGSTWKMWRFYPWSVNLPNFWYEFSVFSINNFLGILWIKYLTLSGIWTYLWYFYPFCVSLPISNHRKTLVDQTGFIKLILMPMFPKRGFHSLNLTKMKKKIHSSVTNLSILVSNYCYFV